MPDNLKTQYFTDILKNQIVWLVIPNLLFALIQYSGVEDFSSLTLVFNALMLPIILMVFIEVINEKFTKDWWYVNYPLCCLTIILSVAVSLMVWGYVNKTPDKFWNISNIDSGTWMMVKLQIQIGCGIIFIGWVRHMIKTS